MEKRLKFHPDLIQPILEKEKTKTWRLFDDKALQKEDRLIFINSQTKEVFAKAQIVEVREKPFKHLTSEDYSGHEVFASFDAMLQTYEHYYQVPITEETWVKIIEFRLL